MPDYENTLATPRDAMHEYARNVGHEAGYSDCQWILTDYDVWVRNPHYHGDPQPHPEDCAGMAQGAPRVEIIRTVHPSEPAHVQFYLQATYPDGRVRRHWKSFSSMRGVYDWGAYEWVKWDDEAAARGKARHLLQQVQDHLCAGGELTKGLWF